MSDTTKDWHAQSPKYLRRKQKLTTQHPGQEFQKFYLQVRRGTESDWEKKFRAVNLDPTILQRRSWNFLIGKRSPSPVSMSVLSPILT